VSAEVDEIGFHKMMKKKQSALAKMLMWAPW
jgi:hypothetical protein